MADPQRIYPANEDLEKAAAAHEDAYKSPPPSAPLAPRSSLVSEKGDPGTPGRVMHVQFPKDQVIPPRSAPRYHSRPPKRRRSFCCRCLKWTCCILFILIVAIVVAAAILYAVFQPRIPKFSVDRIEITSFSVNSDSTISSKLSVDVTARNPNKKIGIKYLGDSYLAVFYSGTELCKGQLPVFYQGHKNTTNLDVTLTGSNVLITNDMVTSLNAQQQEGSIPLRLKADVPVKIKFGKLKTMKITFRVRCNLVVDRLAANTRVNMKEKNCKVRVKL
ncbi:hypothetical protein SUGI_0716710 [Cryptomeria japonica]|uniref:NDR1/HIN1-like protein 6 n=1 Tax=Cryptomeria japonica TaxID=3369 RepID=UPI002414BC19|nr:NDR1/HIN1-like protein 6 [Cryptomeria japonica]GLJ35662.1 hypothetical protein SUGI_0716710 [Cryptomeria japonica]